MIRGMHVRIVGTDPPGREWGDLRPDGCRYANIHVGLQERREPVQLHPADAGEVVWDLEIDVVAREGDLDFRGPCVQGKRGERFVYLTWGAVADGDFAMFRRAKLMLSAVDPAVVRAADADGRRLVGALRLTGGDGGPRCAAVRPPAIEWTAEAG